MKIATPCSFFILVEKVGFSWKAILSEHIVFVVWTQTEPYTNLKMEDLDLQRKDGQ